MVAERVPNPTEHKSLSVVLEHFRELYRHRVLIESLVWRDVKARYRGSVLGYFWTLLNPLLLLLVYQLVFTKYTRAVELHNYAVFLFVGLLPWLWLSSSISTGTNSIIAGGNLITRVCIPPQVLPTVTVLSTLVNFILALPIALIAATAYGIFPAPALILLPLLIVLELFFLYAVVLMLAAMTVRFRDIAFLVHSLLTIWFFLSPIAYPIAAVPERYRTLILANPMAPLLLAFQEVIFFRRPPSATLLALATGWVLALLAIGIRIFEARRDTFAEDI